MSASLTDKQWEKLIRKANTLANEHRLVIQSAESEYENRYGHNPSEIDDDWWIDTLHYGQGDTDLDAIKIQAKLSVERFEGK